MWGVSRRDLLLSLLSALFAYPIASPTKASESLSAESKKGRESTDYDAIVIGAGHNGLICAAYLLKGGMKTLVIEARSLVGGCATTEELFPGYRINTCNCDHMYILTTPIIQDLGLESFGLKYLEMNPSLFIPFPDGSSLTFYRDVEQTVESITRISKKDAKSYRKFIKRWIKIVELLQPVFLSTPSLFSSFNSMITKRIIELPSLLDNLAQLPFLMRSLSRSMSDLVNSTFETAQVKATLSFWGPAMAIQSPSGPGTAILSIAMAIKHMVGVNHPQGGSGMLTESLASMFLHHGGKIITGKKVRKIIVDDRRVRGIELDDGTQITGRTVISAVDPKQTLLKLLDPSCLDRSLRQKVENIQVSDGGVMKVDLVLSELPLYKAAQKEDPRSLLHASQLICPSMMYIERALQDFREHRPSSHPLFMVGTHTAGDPTLAPPGCHTMALEARFFPFTLTDGLSWGDIREREADRLIEMFASYAPNIKKAIINRYIMTPLDMECRLGIPKGNQVHCDQSQGQNFSSRPIPELADYRTPIANLYLTGAGTFPGGGIWGAPGHNTAQVVLRDW